MGQTVAGGWTLSMSEGKCLVNARQNETKVSYPDLLTPAFVTCSTNVGEAWKIDHVQ